jgi:hypothetical protein
MNCLKTVAGSSVALLLTLSAPIAWGQIVPNNVAEPPVTGSYNTAYSMNDSASQMDQNLSHEIKQAWSEGKNATLAMSFQENGEIALEEGKEQQARQYFQAAERELSTLQPEHSSNTGLLSQIF